MVNMRKYVSDVITKDEVLTWEDNDKIKIFAETGKGKTHWAINTLAPTCKDEKKTILYLTHRNSLKMQIITDICRLGLQTTVNVTTYQKITHDYRNGSLDLDLYDVIVCDEYQFLLNDSGFNSYTEVIYELAMEDTEKQIIFISANDVKLGIKFDKTYTIGDVSKDISNRVNKAYSIDSSEKFVHIIREILSETDDKVFVYVNNNDIVEKIYENFSDDVAIYVSKSSPLAKYMDVEDILTLSTTNTVNKRILLSTSAIDSGVSIIDDKFKHILIEERDIEQLYQVVSRKRILTDDSKFNLYLVNIHTRRINGYKTQLVNKLEMAQTFREDELNFYRKYGRAKLDETLFYNDNDGILQVNRLREQKMVNLLSQYNKYTEYGYINVIEDELNVKFIDLDVKHNKETLEEYLDSIVGEVMLQPKDRKELIEKMNVRRNGRLLKGRASLNSALEELDLPYTIRQFRTSRTKNGVRKQYASAWEVLKLTK